MPRYMDTDAEYIYRVVVTTTREAHDDVPEYSSTQMFGSYNTLGAAKVQKTRHQGRNRYWGTLPGKAVDVTIQVTPTEWTTMEED